MGRTRGPSMGKFFSKIRPPTGASMELRMWFLTPTNPTEGVRADRATREEVEVLPLLFLGADQP